MFLESKNDIVNDSIDLSIAQCLKCGHVQSLNDPVSYFRDVITAANLSPRIASARVNTVRRMIGIHEKLETYRLVDIGAGRGDFLTHLEKDGIAECYGIEHSFESVSFAKNRGLSVYQGFLDANEFIDIRIKEEKFNIATCFNFLEHIPEPYVFLENFKLLLSDGAICCFTVPSYQFILDSSCIHEFISDHVSYFTPASLTTLFARSGFSIANLSSINNNNDLQIIVKYNKIQPLGIDVYNRLKSSINETLSVHFSMGHVISWWGAGHRSLTLISQLDYASISCIVDSATFKQEKFSPASRIPIVSPFYFKNNISDVLFVSLPGIYAEEVVCEISEWITRPRYVYIIGNDKCYCIDF